MKQFIKPLKKLLVASVLLFAGFKAQAQVTVVATAGNMGPVVYPDLNSAFAAINAGTHQGSIGVGIGGNTVETGPCVLNSSGAGAALYTSVNINPIVDGVSISGATTTGRGLIELKGADNVTIDGDNPNSAGINRNLTIVNTAANTITYTSCVRIANVSAVVTSSDNITVRNCILTGSATGRNAAANTSTTGSENTTFGIYVGGNGGTTAIDAPTAITSVTANTIPAGTTVNTFLADNNQIVSVARAIVFNGSSAATSTGVTVSNNTIGGAGTLSGAPPYTAPANTVYTKGVWINGTTAITITGNTIQNILSYVATSMTGVELNGAIGAGGTTIQNNSIIGVVNNNTSTAFGILVTTTASNFLISGNTVSNVQMSGSGSASIAGIQITTYTGTSAVIEKNIVNGVNNRTTNGWGSFGINTQGGNNITIQNNFIYDINAFLNNGGLTTTFGVFGIRVNAGTGHKIYYNSVNLFGAVTGSSAFTSIADLVISSSASTGMDIRNNIFANTMTGAPASSAVTCLFLPSGLTSTFNLTENNNAYYQGSGTGAAIAQAGTTSGTGVYTAANFNASVITPATNWRSYSSTLNAAGTNDNASIGSSAAAPFTSNTNLHINQAAPNVTDVNATAVVIGTVSTDIDGNARDASTPDIGADEFILSICAGANGGTISPATVSVCNGQTVAMSSTGTTTGTGITYQWKISATSGGPYANVTGGTGATTTSYTTAALTAGTYYYVLQVTCSVGPTTGLSNELTVTVHPTPTIAVSPLSATYCNPGTPVALTASGAVTYSWAPSAGLSATTGTSVNASPVSSTVYTATGTDAFGCVSTGTTTITSASTPSVTVTATPSTICNGGNSQLLATATIPLSYPVTSIPYAPTVGTGTQAVTGDDAVSGAITLPFTFTYYGTAYTQAFVYTNGFIQLGTSTGSTTTYAKDLTTAAAPNNVIAGVWSDLNAAATQITTYTTGSAPNRIFTVYYNNVQFYSSSTTFTGNTNFQILLYEGSNIVEIHVGAVTGVSTTTANNTLGIENAAGTSNAFPAGRNAAPWTVSTPEAWRFTPNTGSYTYSWNPGTFLSSTTISNPMANTVTANTSYTATITEASGCSSTGSVTITAGSALTSTSAAGPATTVCAGTNVNFTSTPTGGGAPYTYSWTGPNGFSSAIQNPSITGATPAATGVYTIVVTDACSATSTTSVTLTVNPLPTVAVTPTTALYCNPSTAISLSATGATTYAWSPSAGLSATTGSSVGASPVATTTYTVVGTDANGCVSNATTTITSAPAVTGATATATPATICAGSTTNLGSTANPVLGTILNENFNSGAATWTRTNTSTGGTIANAAWTDRPDGFVYAAGTPYHSNDNSQFIQTNSDAQGSGSTTRTTMQSPAFSTVGYSGMNLDFYQFYRDINDNGDSAVVESSLDGINWSIVTAFTTTQGSEAAFSHATVPLPAGLNNQPTVYIRFRYIATWDWYWSIDNVSITGLSPNFTYSWSSTPAGFTSTAQNPSAVLPTASSTYTVQITNAFGCSATANTAVSVNPLPTVVANSTATTVCSGSPVTLSGSGTATSYSWTGSVTDGVSFNPTATNNYTVTGTDANGCSNTDNITITVNPLPVVTLSGTNNFCTGGSTTLTGSSGVTNQWYMNGAMIVGASSNTYSVTAPGEYNLTNTNINGCSDSAATGITVIENPLPTVVANSTASAVCAGSPVTLTGSGATTYTWDNSVTDGVSFVPSATATYMVTGTDGNGCQNTDMTTVTVNPIPTVVANASATTVCSGSPVTLTGSGTATSFTWSGGVSDGVAFNATSTNTYTVIGTDGNACSDSDMVTINVNPLPTVTINFPTDTVCVNGGNFTLSGESPAGGVWSGSGVSGNIFDPTVPGVGFNLITYTYSDVNSCTAMDTSSLWVDVCNGIVEHADLPGMNVFPNPNNGQFTVVINQINGNGSLTITDALGQLISSEDIVMTKDSATKQIDLGAYANGIYFIQFTTATTSVVQKVTVQH